jgi:signal transduction histidine kinase
VSATGTDVPGASQVLRAVLERAREPAWLFDAHGQIVWANPRAVVLDPSVGANTHATFLNLVAYQDVALAERVADDALARRAGSDRIRLRSGQVVTIETTPIEEAGRVTGFVWMVRGAEEHSNELHALELELEVLRAVTLASARSSDLGTLLERSLDAVLHVTGLAPVGGVFVVDDELGELRLVAQRGLPPSFVESEQRVPLGECLCGIAAATGEMIHSPSSAGDARHSRHWGAEAHSHVIVPLSARERVRGVMFLYPTPDYVLDESGARLFATVGQQLGLAIESLLARKSATLELRRRIAALEARLAAARETQAIERDAGDAIAMVAHDLRAPLSGILAQAELLSHRAKDRAAEWVDDSAESIIRISQRMNALVSDLVESSRLESGELRLDRHPVTPRVLVADILDVLPETDRARVLVECAADAPAALVDRERIARALVNLVTNALKYSPSHQPVHIRVSSDVQYVRIAVEDQGVGIEPDKLPHVFERFYRAGRETGPAGLGLGLYITRLLVEAHGGEVAASSVPGQSSTFRVALPRPSERLWQISRKSRENEQERQSG